MHRELVSYYESHPNDQIIVTRGEDKRVGTINRDLRFPPNSDYVIVPVSLQMKLYRHVPAAELDLLEQECQEEGIKFAAEIKGSLGGDLDPRPLPFWRIVGCLNHPTPYQGNALPGCHAQLLLQTY
jgi:hypothetical protein